MRFRLPSFRTQIILLVVLLIVTSVLFFREFFINSFQSFSDTSETLSTNEKSRKLYEDYNLRIKNTGSELKAGIIISIPQKPASLLISYKQVMER